MEHRLTRIEDKLDKVHDLIQAQSVAHEKRLTTLETRQKGMIGVGGIFLTAMISGLLKKLGL